MKFIESIKARAKSNKKTIVLPETSDILTITASAQIISEGISNLILILNKEEIIKKAGGTDLSELSKATFIDPSSYEKSEELANMLFELRQAKGMTLEQAKKLVYENALYFGVMLVKSGVADGMVAGAVNSTADVIRPCVQIIKTNPASKLVSAFFVMCVPNCQYGNNGVFIFTDSGMNPNPDAEQLAYIAIDGAKSYKQLIEVEPVVAMLSHSTMGSAKNDDVAKVVSATKLAKELAPDITLDGEFQLDAAIIPAIGASKAPGNPVAGKANVLVFPDLDAGNIAYKLVERLANAEAYGPIMAGIAKPVNDLSRGCTAEDIVGVVAITAVQAQASV
jgi:phosphate acetyltransferase